MSKFRLAMLVGFILVVAAALIAPAAMASGGPAIPEVCEQARATYAAVSLAAKPPDQLQAALNDIEVKCNTEGGVTADVRLNETLCVNAEALTTRETADVRLRIPCPRGMPAGTVVPPDAAPHPDQAPKPELIEANLPVTG